MFPVLRGGNGPWFSDDPSEKPATLGEQRGRQADDRSPSNSTERADDALPTDASIRELRQLGQEEHRQSEELADCDLRILRVEQKLAHLEKTADALQQRQSKLENQIASLLAARTRERPDLATNSHSTHHIIALEFRALVEQRIQAFARSHSHRSRRGTHWPEAQRVPRFIGAMSRHLFYSNAATIPLLPQLVRELGLPAETDSGFEALREVRAACVELGKRVQATGLQARWDFQLNPGSALDTARQTPWSSCDPQAPVQFLVAPAYLVEGQIYTHQYVYTETTRTT